MSEDYVSKLNINSAEYLISASKASADSSGRSIASAIDKIEEFDEIDYNEISIGTGLKLENNTISVNTAEIPSESYYNIAANKPSDNNTVILGEFSNASSNSFAFGGTARNALSWAEQNSVAFGFGAAVRDSFSVNGYALEKSISFKGQANYRSISFKGNAFSGSVAIDAGGGPYCTATSGSIAIKGYAGSNTAAPAYASCGGFAIKGGSAEYGGVAFGPGSYASAGWALSIGTNYSTGSYDPYSQTVERGFAVGNNNHVTGGYAIGRGLVSEGPFVIGSYNQIGTNAAFVIGGGSDNDNRKDLLTVNSNGMVSLNTPGFKIQSKDNLNENYLVMDGVGTNSTEFRMLLRNGNDGGILNQFLTIPKSSQLNEGSSADRYRPEFLGFTQNYGNWYRSENQQLAEANIKRYNDIYLAYSKTQTINISFSQLSAYNRRSLHFISTYKTSAYYSIIKITGCPTSGVWFTGCNNQNAANPTATTGTSTNGTFTINFGNANSGRNLHLIYFQDDSNSYRSSIIWGT